ncbi:nucleoside-diphosphate sugar epimerase/dehydratase [Sphingosinicella sp. LHD-64]|uniref:polysaccharide biosynthesis protein n=1 Tax=Sphingosinicella sp. LHD-64 TaxID=3072139 RepID=UPI00280FEE0E|nr:nucleoside-diphosphate sugar epimerase/dehydratase [Sphingosinicella sp. LHD-64]MDQ8757216.1 nucleoside-diphosphate sugar epimerase/dehydratase [Sphingosinicella sp. LHD-64]
MIEPVLGLPRLVKKAIALALDAGLCVLTVWLAFWLRLGEWISLSGYGWPAALGSVIIALPIFVAFGLYRAVFRYASWDALTSIIQAVFVYGVIYAAVFTAFAVPGVPRTVGVIQPILLLLALAGARAAVRYWLGGRYRRHFRQSVSKNVLIYGAGTAGRQLADAISDSLDTRLVGFIDDNQDLRGSVIRKVGVYGPGQIEEVVDRFDVEEIFLAIPSARQTRRNEILDAIRPTGVGVRTLPGLLDIAQGKVAVSQLRPLDIEDLLGRDPVAPDTRLVERNTAGKVVLVTGAGGSIGSELCRQILSARPRMLLVADMSEYALYAIHKELLGKREGTPGCKTEIVPLLASVCDEERMRRIFSAWRPETIYHAAAYKHVPLVEHNLVEGVRNNVVGTRTCALLAQEFQAESFVLISTDKAVRPTNVMGASKRLAEMQLQALAERRPQTCFSMVRFGNVLGSSGSVVPAFRQQISLGGPVTVTHPEITRYFMTIPEAAQLVLQAGAMARGGDVFVLDMGQPVKIVDLAKRMIELSGLKPFFEGSREGDVEIIFSGLRPGEKLYEELLIGGNPAATSHPRIMVADESFLPHAELTQKLAGLFAALGRQDVESVRRMLMALVPEFSPSSHLMDLVHTEEAKSGLRMNLGQAIP